MSDSISNDESADESQEIQEPTEDTTPELNSSDEDDKKTKDKE